MVYDLEDEVDGPDDVELNDGAPRWAFGAKRLVDQNVKS